MRSAIRSGWGLEKKVNTVEGSSTEFNATTKGDSGVPVGLGRSYGDSALNSKGQSWNALDHKHIEIDVATGMATVGAGASIGELERAAIPFGLFPAVVPGTEFVTIGGAIAADVHGKSHHKYGTFTRHVIGFKLLNARGEIKEISATNSSSDTFFATSGGMGLTGLILEAKIQLIPIKTSYFQVHEKRACSLNALISTINEFDRNFDYTVAWIDFSGKYKGRGIVSGGNHANASELPKRLAKVPLKNRAPRRITLPKIFPSSTINRFSVRLFNEFWYRKPVAKGYVHASKFLHPLDPIQKWNRIYGKRGFLQYQFVVPLGAEHFIEEVLNELKAIRAPSFLSVLKKFEGLKGPFLSFPMPGWTLAIDMPIGIKGLTETLTRLDSKVIALGGRVYLAKDSRVSREDFQKMYPEYAAWLKIKNRMDPENYWQSDQGRRLGLC
jgi:decaprenylphospho-beta-D-ribofuranose 2-oxidase